MRAKASPGRGGIALFGTVLLFATASPAFQSPPSQAPIPRDDRQLVHPESSPATTPPPAPVSAQGSTQSRPELVLQTGLTVPQTRIVFSPDGRLLASMSIDGRSITLWECATGRVLRKFDPGQGPIGYGAVAQPISFSDDGRTLIGFLAGFILRWEVGSGREVSRVAMSGANVAFRPVLGSDGRILAAVVPGTDTVATWDTATGSRQISAGTSSPMSELVPERIAIAQRGDRVCSMMIEVDFARSRSSYRALLQVWNIVSGQLERTIDCGESSPLREGGSGMPSSLDMSPDGALVSYISDATAFVWDVSTGRLISQHAFPTMPERTIGSLHADAQRTCFSPDHRRMAIATDAGSIEIADTATGAVERRLDGHQSVAATMTFSRDGALLASTSIDRTIRIWDVATGITRQTLTGATAPVTDVAFSPDGRSIVVADNGATCVWDTGSGDCRRTVAIPEEFLAAASESKTVLDHALSPDGATIVKSSAREPLLRIWNTASGRVVQSIPLRPGRELSSAAFSADATAMAIIDRNNAEARVPGRVGPPGPPGPQGSPGRPPVDQGEANRRLLEEVRKDPRKARSKEFQELIRKMSSMDASDDPVSIIRNADELGLLPPGQRLLNVDFGLSVVEPHTARIVQSIPFPKPKRMPLTEGPGSLLTSAPLALSPDGKLLAFAFEFGAPVAIHDVSTGREIRTLAIPDMPFVYSIAFSPDGQRVAIGALLESSLMSAGAYVASSPRRDSILAIFDVNSGSIVARSSLESPPLVLSFSADGRFVASGSFITDVTLRDATTGAAIRTFTGHSSSVTALSFSPDGRYLITGSSDGSTRLWDTQSGEMLATLAIVNGGADWLVVTPDGRFDGSSGGWNQILWRFSADPLDVAPVESFFSEYFRPGLLGDLLAGRNIRAAVEISKRDRRQPVVAISPATPISNSTGVTSRTLGVRVDVTSAPAGARDVRLFRNGSLVRVWRGDVLNGQPTVQLEADVKLVAGPNVLTAYAFNGDDVKSVDATLLVTGHASLQRAGTLRVLAVGVDGYANPEFNLKYAGADATIFADEIERQQRRIGTYANVEVTRLRDRDATREAILTALERLASVSEPEDGVVVYFAGHGIAQDDRFYLIPHDLGYGGSRAALTAAGLSGIVEHAISDLDLQRVLERLEAGRAILVIDACNSGQALEASDARQGPMNSRGLAQLAYEKGLSILTAAQSYQAALEDAQLGHGYLTFALVEEGLRAKAADGAPADGSVMLREWFEYATARVPELQQQRDAQRSLTHDAAQRPAKNPAVDARDRVQRPRAFYRREPEAIPFVVARP